MKKTWKLGAALGIFALVLTGCGGDSDTEGTDTNTEAAADGELREVSIGGVVTTSTVPIYIAQEEGIFEKHGLDVTMVPTQNFSAAAPSLLNGQLDFATAAVPPFIMAIDQGMELAAVAGTSATVEDPELEGNQLVVAEGSDLTSAEDLSGKVVATNAIGSGPYVGVLATYVNAGGGADDIEWVSMPMNEQIQALENGTIDGAVLAEPFTSMAIANGHQPIMSAFRQPGLEILEPNDPYVVLLGAQSYLEANPDIAEAMRESMIEANAIARDNPDMVVDLLVAEADLDPEVAATMMKPGFVAELSGDELQRMADAMEKAGMLTNPFSGADAVWNP